MQHMGTHNSASDMLPLEATNRCLQDKVCSCLFKGLREFNQKESFTLQLQYVVGCNNDIHLRINLQAQVLQSASRTRGWRKLSKAVE